MRSGSGSTSGPDSATIYSLAALATFVPLSIAAAGRGAGRPLESAPDSAGRRSGRRALHRGPDRGGHDRATGGQLLILCIAVSSVLTAFHVPALEATIPLMVLSADLGRANGLLQVTVALAYLMPAVAGFLLHEFGLTIILLVDGGTFLLAMLAILAASVPESRRDPGQAAARPGLYREFLQGWRFVCGRRALLALLLVSGVGAFALGTMQTLAPPLVLTVADSQMLGLLLGLGALGIVTGGVVMMIRGGPGRKIHGVLGMMLLQGCALLFFPLHPTALVGAVGAFLLAFAWAFVDACQTTIWQQQVPAHIQGRVLSRRPQLGPVDDVGHGRRRAAARPAAPTGALRGQAGRRPWTASVAGRSRLARGDGGQLSCCWRRPWPGMFIGRFATSTGHGRRPSSEAAGGHRRGGARRAGPRAAMVPGVTQAPSSAPAAVLLSLRRGQRHRLSGLA